MLYAGPFTLTANAFDGYRFVRWVDENGNEVSTNASLLVGRDLVSGRYEAHTYYAVFAELESVTIDYTVSNSNVVWVDFRQPQDQRRPRLRWLRDRGLVRRGWQQGGKW